MIIQAMLQDLWRLYTGEGGRWGRKRLEAARSGSVFLEVFIKSLVFTKTITYSESHILIHMEE